LLKLVHKYGLDDEMNDSVNLITTIDISAGRFLLQRNSGPSLQAKEVMQANRQANTQESAPDAAALEGRQC
jgi:hypothetical protein